MKGIWGKTKLLLSIFNFHGFYVVLGILAIAGGLSASQTFTIPLRLVTTGLMLLGLIIFIRKKYFINKYLLIYLVFVLLYGIRLILEHQKSNPDLLHSVSGYTQYFIVYSLVPFTFYLFNTKTAKDYELIKKGHIVAGVVFAFISLYLYGDLLLQNVGRLGDHTTSKILQDDSVLSPLVLSYISVSTIVILLQLFLFKEKMSSKEKTILLAAIVLLIPIFLLGASRGSFIGLFVVVLFFIFQLDNLKRILRLLLIFGIPIAIMLVFLEAQTNFLLGRIENLFSDDILNNLRVIMYITTFEQFLANPVIGTSIQNDVVNHFPHNIYLESLSATGFLGFLAIAYLTYIAFKKSFIMIKTDNSIIWLPAIFIIYFVHSIFNGTIFLAINFWSYMAMILAYKINRKEK